MTSSFIVNQRSNI